MRDREEITVAIDGHKIPRYDRKPGNKLLCPRHQKGTTHFETYMMAQCVIIRIPLVLAM